MYTDIVVVLDRSGSMATVKGDMEGGFNEYIEKQKLEPGEAKVSLYQFDDVYEVVYEGVPLKDVPKLNLVPRNMTALIDAVGRTILETGERLSRMPEHERPNKVLFIVITDGHENSSRSYNRQQVADMISHQRDKYSWQFVFIGANMDAYAEARSFNIDNGSSLNWVQTAGGIQTMYDHLGSGTACYRAAKETKTCGFFGDSGEDPPKQQADLSDLYVSPHAIKDIKEWAKEKVTKT